MDWTGEFAELFGQAISAIQSLRIKYN